MGYGQDGHIGISFQDSYGTSNVDSLDYFPFISETITEGIEELMSESLESRYEEPDDYEGIHSVEGEISMEVHPHLAGKLLKAWCGQYSQDAYVGSCYQHLFVPRTTDWEEEKAALQPMTVEVYRDTGSAYLYYDMMLNQLTFELAQGALYKCTAGFVGARFSWASKTTPSYITASEFTWDTCSISLAASGVDDWSQFTITLNNNLAAKHYLDGSKYAGRILRDGNRVVEIAGTALLVGDTEVRNYRQRTQQRLIITATDPATVALGHNKLEIDIPKMRYSEFPANIAGTGLIEVGFSAKGKYDSTSSYAVQFTLVNTTAAY